MTDATIDLVNVTDVAVSELLVRVGSFAERKARFITTTCLDAGDALEIYYHFDVEMAFHSLRIRVPKEDAVPSITAVYACAFLAENEMQSLFGAHVTGLAVDYGGRLLVTDDGPPPFLKGVK